MMSEGKPQTQLTVGQGSMCVNLLEGEAVWEPNVRLLEIVVGSFCVGTQGGNRSGVPDDIDRHCKR